MSLLKKVWASLTNGTLLSKLSFKFWCIYYFFIRWQKVDSRKVVCQNFAGRGYADNPKYIAEELHRVNPSFSIVWLVDARKITDFSQFPDYVRTVEIKSKLSLKELASAGFWIDNIRNGLRVPKKKNQCYIQTWHGTLPIKKIEKDAEGLLSSSYVAAAKKDSRITDVCISGCSAMTTIFKKSFWYSGSVLECGSPKNDVLFKHYDSSVRDTIGLAEESPLCLYAPTFRTDKSAFKYRIDYKSLKTVLDETFGGRWNILVRLHPNVAEYNLEDLPPFVKNVSLYPDVQELLSISSCVVTDFSSIMFDFALMRRPVFLFVPDFDEYQNSEREFYFALTETPFAVAKTDGDLAQNIGNFEENAYKRETDLFFGKFRLFDDGHASERVVQWMLKRQH